MTGTDEAAAAAHLLAAEATGWLWRGRQHAALDPDEADLDPDGAYKALGETALAASLVLRERVAGAEQRQAATDLLAFAWSELRGGDLLYARQLRYPTLTDAMETYAHFARAGYRHAALDDLLAHVVALRPAVSQELLPNRRLAVLNAQRTLGLPGAADLAAVTATTWLGDRPEPWTIDWLTGYHLTHTVFHVTDWGARPAGLPAELDAYLRLWLPVWFDVWTETAHWDLAGELLVVDACLREPVCPPGAWSLLRAVQRPDGSLPRDDQPAPDGVADAYRHDSHPTVVAAIAGTLGLSRRLRAAPVPA